MFGKKKQEESKKAAEQTPTAALEGKQTPKEELGAPSLPPAETPVAPMVPAEQQSAQAEQVDFDLSDLVKCYANFCRVTGTPEEVILDLGLNPQAIGASVQSVRVSQRVIMNYYTAKRMLGALHVTIKRHEEAFGVLETNVQKRAVQT